MKNILLFEASQAIIVKIIEKYGLAQRLTGLNKLV
jgi:hypothetical protein